MALTLDELVQNRNELIEAHRKNNFTDGIHALLTDLYPDTAHFIYELLQNAEDMNASAVRFSLDKNGINFEHNGTKRAFNIADIDAITNIGHNSQKKDDPTSIGKFGVGFKAVFAYTATPIIHSGDYHFKIRDYFVPEFEGVEKVETLDSKGVSWTKFSFPFNNPKKPASMAYAECFEGLKELDSSAILFLQNIRKIDYSISGGGKGFVHLTPSESHHVTVEYQKPNEKTISSSHWLRFSKIVNITDDQGKPKQLSIATAFALEFDEKTKKEKIVPVKSGGRTFIYFPAEKEHSGLRFHINAPFASTVARDSVRNCEDNKKLIKAISQLIVDSLSEIKLQGLMTHAFFEVLPNNKDNLSFFYQTIFDYVYVAFQNNDYLPTKTGGFTTAKLALLGPVVISNLLKDVDLEELTGIKKTWIANAGQKNSHADNFIHSLDIQTYSYSDFTQIFDVRHRFQTEKLIANKHTDWLKKFYILCSNAYDDADYSSSRVFIQNMKQTCFIRSTAGTMFKPTEIFILPPNTALITKTTPIVEHSIVLSTAKSDRSPDIIKAFFQDTLDIREYGPKIEIEKLLKKYAGEYDADNEYFKDMLSLAKYKSDHDDIDFSSHSLFIFMSKDDHELYITKASELFLGKAYGNDVGELLADVYEKNCLWSGYAEHYKEGKELQQFITFAVSCGARKGLTIVEQDAFYNPQYHSLLCDYSRRTTGYGLNSDYTIPGLEKILKVHSIEISKLIWSTLERYGKGNIYGSPKYVTARYAPNASAMTKTCDSTLIYYLKEYAWIPDKQGNLRKPEDISIAELRKDFVYDSGNKLLEALKLGSAAEKQSQKQVKAKKAAEEAGMYAISEEDYQLLQKAKAQQEREKRIAPMSGQDLLKKQKKKSIPNINDGDDFSSDGAVNNVARRETNIEATFRNAKQMKPAQRKLFGRIIESTKNERKMLRNWYQGKCQMCNTQIKRFDGSPHFVAKNIINTQHLSASIRQTTELAWNSLCLCPNCAAKYDVCSRDLNSLYDQIMQTEVIEGNAERIVLTIELEQHPQEIHYVPKHFLALKKVMQLIDKETRNESETK